MSDKHAKKTYIVGFIASVVLTLAAYWLVTQNVFSYWVLVLAISVLAVVQLFVQLYFFLHLGQERKPRLKLTAFIFAAMVVVIVVYGSVWIMQNLDYHHGETPAGIDDYVQDEEAIHKHHHAH